MLAAAHSDRIPEKLAIRSYLFGFPEEMGSELELCAVQRPAHANKENGKRAAETCASYVLLLRMSVLLILFSLFALFDVFACMNASGEHSTLQDYLSSVLPLACFTDSSCSTLQPDIDILIQGIRPTLNTPLYWLWQHCSHPDMFLYIVVVQRNHADRT